MYSMSQLLQGIRQPRRAILELNQIYNEYILGTERINVMHQDWDTLVILDGCRFDLFASVNHIPGSLQSVISRGSSTAEFLHGNFAEDAYLDTVYVSANPQLERHDMVDKFFACERLWDEEWDSDLKTVHPERVTDRTIEAHERYPDKRLLVHFVQPHFPFIGKSGQEIAHSGFAETPGNLEETEHPTVWERLEEGDLSREQVWEAYRENLEIALPEVERLLAAIPGRSIITSDHGNAFGEWGVYGHPGNHYLDALVRVPWLVVEGEQRREIVEADTASSQNHDGATSVEERLADLGYR